MNLNFRFLVALTSVFFILFSACKSTNELKDQSKEEVVSGHLSPADLAQMKDAVKLNPDAAMVSGKVTRVVDEGVLVEVATLEKQGFGFSEAIAKGSIITVSGGDVKKLKKGDAVLLVISAIRVPGADVSYNLEKLLAPK